jgi:HTH-type transcriptional regulator/antitoxin HipB
MMMVEHGVGSSEGDSELGLWIRQRRFERGLKQHVLAERAGLSRRWLVEVENGRLQPKFSDLLRLVEVLGADLMEAPGVRRSSRSLGAGNLAHEEGTETNRREFMGWIAAAAGSAALIDVERLASPVVDTAWLRDAEIISMGLAGQYSKVQASSLLPAVLGHLSSLESMLPATAEVAARTALLAGNLITRTRTRRGHAYRCFVLAESLGSPTVVAKSMNGRATLYGRAGDLTQAIAMQDEAVSRLGTAAPSLRACLLARRAELRAEAGSDVAAMRDLDAAERVLSGAYDWWYFGLRNPVELGAYRGVVLSRLGRHAEAAEALTWVLDRMDPSKVMWRATVAADRDAALAQL